VAASLLLLGLATTLAVRAGEPRALSVQGGVSILVLDGRDNHERGLAHGRALARPILETAGQFEKLRQRSMPDRATFKSVLKKFVWESDVSAELDGIVDGVREVLGADVKVPGTDRAFDRSDLEGINTIPDLLPFGCSSFTIAGARVEGGGTLTARNLDYPPLDGALDHHLVIVRRFLEGGEHPGVHGWATVSWPGCVGCFTGMSDAGITASIHDVRTGPEMLMGTGFTPRTVGLRRILEQTASGEGFADRAAAVLRRCPVVYGNNIHVSAPREGGNTLPAVILEWDSDREKEGGVTVRAAPPGEPLVCTNHWRLRREPEPCNRYDALVKVLGKRSASWTAASALEALRASAVAGPGGVTIHSVVFSLEKRTLLVAFARDKAHAAPFEAGTSLDLGALFQGSTPPAKRWY
jgi:hypothetical protein